MFLNKILSQLSQGTGLIVPSNSISVCAMGRGGGKAAAQFCVIYFLLQKAETRGAESKAGKGLPQTEELERGVPMRLSQEGEVGGRMSGRKVGSIPHAWGSTLVLPPASRMVPTSEYLSLSLSLLTCGMGMMRIGRMTPPRDLHAPVLNPVNVSSHREGESGCQSVNLKMG